MNIDLTHCKSSELVGPGDVFKDYPRPLCSQTKCHLASSFPHWMLRIPSPGPMTMTRAFYTRLSGNDKRKHHCLLPGLGRKATSLAPGVRRLLTFLSHVFIPLDYGFLSLAIFYYRDSPYSGQRDPAKMKGRVCHSLFLDLRILPKLRPLLLTSPRLLTTFASLITSSNISNL